MVTTFLKVRDKYVTAFVAQNIIDNRYAMKKIEDRDSATIVELTRLVPIKTKQTFLTLTAAADTTSDDIAKIARYIRKRIDSFGKLVSFKSFPCEKGDYKIYVLLTNLKNVNSLISFIRNCDGIETVSREEMPEEFVVDLENPPEEEEADE